MSYKKDPNNSNKMVPDTPRIDYPSLNKSTLPAAKVIQERPSSVILNKLGTYGFMYETSCSLGAVVAYSTSTDGVAETFVSGGAIVADTAGPVELPIQPVAWVRDNDGGAEGDVIFVYRGVK